MPSDKGRPAKPSWRTEVPSSSEKKREAVPNWKKDTATTEKSGGGKHLTRKTKLGAGVLAFLLFNGLLVWVIYWLWPPKPACLVLIGAGYENNLAVPHNVYGWNSLDGLAELSKGGASGFMSWGSAILQLRYDPKELTTDIEWDKGLADFNERTVIVFLALHGGADSQGAFLLPQDTNFTEEQRLRVGQVLDRLAKIPDEKKKLLILDATQVPAHWSLGMLHNDFARGLRDLKERIEKIPNLVVMSASDIDQRSWPSEELRKTIFAHFVIEGLRGAADEPPTGNENGRIDAHELHQYVSRNVERWVRANRDARQTPVLLGGEDRARDVELVVVKERNQAPASATEETAPTVDIAKETGDAWKKFQALNKQVPSPVVYTPHLWRQYQDTVIRYEQLLRAGDRRKAPEVKKDLEKLEEDIARAQRLELNCTATSLAMPMALGQNAPWSDRDIAAHVSELFKAPPERYEQVWDGIQKSAPDHRNKSLLRLRITGQLLERAAESPKANLDKVCTLLRIIGVSGNQRPIEAHYAAMLLRDLDKKEMPPDGVVIKALRLRRLAENVALAIQLDAATGAVKNDVHPYSEQIYPWIQEKVAAADDLRRRGEDRLFSTEADAWKRAGDDLQKAEDGYRAIQADADRVRAALHTRDQVLLALPYYSLWMARRRAVEESDLKNLDDLWKDTHYLVRILETPNPKRITEAVPFSELDLKPHSVNEQTKNVALAFKVLEETYTRQCNDLSGAVLQSVWRDTDDALSVPANIDPDLRIKLLMNAKAASRTFHVKTMDDKTSDAPGITEERNTEVARQTAQRQGRMALAVLGQRWFDDPVLFVGRASEKYGEVENRIKKFHTEERWWQSLARAEEEVGLRWRRMPEEIVKLTENSRKSNLKMAAGDLVSGERLARQMDGAGAAFLAKQSINPVDEHRRLVLHDLLLWQAERTRTDHWFAEDPSAEPYYLFSGNLFVQDAKVLIHVPEARGESSQPSRQLQQERLEPAAKMETALRQPGELAAAGPARLDVTSERRIPIEYRLEKAQATGWVPPGYPVVWLETGKFLQASEDTGRRVLETGDKQSSSALAFEFTPSSEGEPPRVPKADKTSATLRGLYRGQRIEKATPINLHRLPETVVYSQPVMLKSGIAVRAAPQVHQQFAPDNGAVAIVLDCSGSMGPKEGVKYDRDTPCKYHEATGALKKVLQKLPDGVTLSVIVYSHEGKVAGKPKNSEEIDQLIELIRPPSVWRRDQLGGLMDRVEPLVPWNETPVVRSMWRAKREGFPDNFRGFKTLVVLTDGEDNLFERDRQLNPTGNAKIADYINKEFAGFGLVVNIVGFKVAAEEKARFQEQFQDVIEKQLPLKGKFYTVENTNELVDKLGRDLKQSLRFKIEREGGGFITEMPEDGFSVSRDTESDRWVSLEPGPYKVRVQTNRILEQRIHLARGDFMLVSVAPDGLSFERIVMGDDYSRWRPNMENYGWLMTVLQNQLKPDRSMEMLLSLENRKDRAPKSGTLQQIRPRYTWIEVKPQGTEEPIAVRWGDMSGYPAPAWSVNVPFWPSRSGAAEAAKPLVTAWWNWEEDPPRAATLKRAAGADFQNHFKGRETSLGAEVDKVVIDSVTIEERPIETKPGVKEQVSCLVVRVNHPPGKPVWVQLDGLEIQGQEHHFFAQASKYTGIFWAVKKDVAQDKLLALDLFSLERFKRTPTTSRMELKFDEPPDTRPRPKTIPELVEVK